MRKKNINASEFYRKANLLALLYLTGLGVTQEEPSQDSSPVKS